MATQTVVRETAPRFSVPLLKEALDKLKGKNGGLRDELAVKREQLQMVAGRMQELHAKIPRVAGPLVIGALSAGSAYGAGYVTEVLEEKGWQKVGPFQLVPLVGFAASIASLIVPDPDLQAGFAAIGNGVAASGMAAAGREKRKTHKVALDAQKAQAAAKK